MGLTSPSTIASSLSVFSSMGLTSPSTIASSFSVFSVSSFPSVSLGALSSFPSSFSSFSASFISTSMSVITSGASSSSSFSFLPFFPLDDFRDRFLTGSVSEGGGVVFTFSLILDDRLGVSPVPQSNSEALGPPGCALRYCSSCFRVVISSPVGAVNTISFFFGVPGSFGRNYT
ncbi:hypothetical protein Hanom_Chr09g00770081 [Helianthus anomalus]